MFNTFINETYVKSIKNDLLQHNRSRKLCTSTQLSEALAFGFGFNTHAALLEELKSDRPATCVSLNDDRLWSRLSKLSETPVKTLQEAIEIDLSESFSRAVGIRDMRDRVTLPGDIKNSMERFFKLMAYHGAAYYTIKGMRLPSTAIIATGGYRRGKQAMRQPFVPSKSKALWQWDATSLNSMLADDFLEDHAGPHVDLTHWAAQVTHLMEPDLKIGSVVFHAETGLTVHHEEIEGCNQSLVYQRSGQLDDVRAADARVSQIDLITT